jgi:NAD(P)-dependent dehydrogenase (short-subunit alcohol dehydrogenase family)
MGASEAESFTGRVAIVTGAGRGIGRQSALAFARRGASVVVADIDPGAAKSASDEIADEGLESCSLECDVSDEASVESMVAATVRRYGRLDFAHNNAGIAPPTGNTVDCTREDWGRVLETNLTGVFLCMKYEIPAMLPRGGAIVNTASTAGLVAFPDRPAYVASKFGLVGLTRAAALDFAARNVRVNAICPWLTMTPMLADKAAAGHIDLEALAQTAPMGRMGKDTEMAAAAVWLCSDSAGFITGAIVPVDGGMSSAPSAG